MNFHKIDYENWERKTYFEQFMNQIRCTYSITSNIDITELYWEIKQTNLKLYPIQIYIISTLVNRYKEFRTCYDGEGNLGYWEQTNPSYTIFHKDSEMFSNLWTNYSEIFSKFYSNYESDYKKYGKINGLEIKPNTPPNTFPISCLPWVSFTGFNLNIYTDGTYLLPIFTIGKYYKENDRILLPLSIQVHHSVCDGFHISRFIQSFQEMALDFKDWMK